MAQPKFSVKAYQGKDPYCFVSYSHADADVIFSELDRLNDHGFRVYYDEGIHPGHAWHDDLARAIEDCSLLIFFVSKNSVASSNCQREINFALDRDKPILAIHIEDVELPSGLHLALGDRQAIVRSRFEEAEFRDRIKKAVSEHVNNDEVLPKTERVADPPPSSLSKRWIAIALILVIVAGGWFYFDSQQKNLERLTYEQKLDEIDQLLARDRFSDAYLIMKDLDPSEDPRRSEYAERIVVPGTLAVAQEGVSVSFKPYGSESEFIPVGTTPFSEPTPLPRGVLQFHLALEGHDSRDIVAINPGPLFGNDFYMADFGNMFTQAPVSLSVPGQIPADWVEIPASDQPTSVMGWSRNVAGMDAVYKTSRFLASKFEVTNEEFKAFVNDGGYSKPDYWEGLEFDDGEQALSFAEAMARFVDQTGRAGPAGWELSNYREGEAGLPVVGISWFEAAAYARYRNLSLPTIYQWSRFAHGPIEGLYPLTGAIERESNFSRKKMIPAREEAGLGPWGTFNTAGNAGEWVWNKAGELGMVQGSHWNSYGNSQAVLQESRWSRLNTSGLRLVQNLPTEPFDTAQLDPIDVVLDDPLVSREPLSDEAFSALRFQFSAPKRLPISVDSELLESNDHWSVTEYQLRFGEQETFVVYVFLPTSGQPPYQTVLFAPPGDGPQPGQANRDAVSGQIRNFDFILRGGRAVVMPIWMKNYERYVATATDDAARMVDDRTGALLWHRDSVDALDFIEAVDELDHQKVSMMGVSYGAAVYEPLAVALNDRIHTAIFISGGLVHTRSLNPMLDGINWFPRITQPVLQLNGIYDHLFPWEQSAIRQFELLGTTAENKKLVGYDAGHISFPRNQMVAEISDWLDKVLGPVQ